ncbi:MAG: AAA family ATPase, partial [Lachnospiraceae bacterium]|nr:AAA family ATPase [Lachnospiraceae bacterium]
MGFYLDSDSAYALYKSEVQKPYFVDKTSLLEELCPLAEQGKNYICITRPRRFGKTVMANMIGAFFCMGADSADIFDNLDISRTNEYKMHRNRHHVVYMDFSRTDGEIDTYDAYIDSVKRKLKMDLREAYPEVPFQDRESAADDFERVRLKTGDKFLFVLDEWDAVFHMSFVTEENQKSYLLFLKDLLKDRAYVSLAYMTGILPISKYSGGSELNMFAEYNMATMERYSSYFGFTEKEVDMLYGRYLENCRNPKVTREGLRLWYDGYCTASGEKIYNPRSVVFALLNNQLYNYWTTSGPYDEIFYYIQNNIADVKEDLALMVSGEAVPAEVHEYAATSMDLRTRDEIFSAMVVYGLLTYEDGMVSIPNKELMDNFGVLLKKEEALGYMHRLAKASGRMMRATKCGDVKTMAEILSYAHDTETPILNYNNEVELSAIVNLVYLSARDQYRVVREDKAGIGYVDFIFYPNNPSDDGIILELKVDYTPEAAIKQIKERKYLLRFQGKLGEPSYYTGRILAVGIGYDKGTKTHA